MRLSTQKPLHLIPLAPNFPAVDSILYDPNDKSAVLTCIQITINNDHPIVVSGLKDIQSWLDPKNSSLGELRPRKNKPWRFVFVVPSHMAPTFKLQRLDGDTPGKVHRYVLGLEEKPIFSRTPDSSAQVRC